MKKTFIRMIVTYLLVSGWFIPVSFVLASSLPADGGEPGKAYKACVDAVAKPDKAAMVALCFAKDDPWIKKANLDYFTNETFQVEVRIQWPALRLINVKITGGKMTADDAEISVQGTMLLQRVEPTDDIVEVDRYPVKGTVKLQRKDGVWRYAGTEKLEK
jgi:hypothetical protein